MSELKARLAGGKKGKGKGKPDRAMMTDQFHSSQSMGLFSPAWAGPGQHHGSGQQQGQESPRLGGAGGR